MAEILICCTPAHGHVAPMLAIARHLAELGHGVRMLTGSRYADRVAAAGIEYLPLPPAADIDLDDTEVHTSEIADLKPIAQMRYALTNLFIKPAPAQVRAVDAAVRARPVDVIVTEMMFMGAAVLQQVPRDARPPIATIGIVPLAAADPDVAPYGLGVTPMPGPFGRARNAIMSSMARRIFAPVHAAVGDVFNEVLGKPLPAGFDLFDVPAHTDLVLQLTVPGFEYPRATLPAHVRFVGPMPAAPSASIPLPDWWDELDGRRPVVHVSQGTIANRDFTELAIPAMRALEHEDVTVVVSTGGRPVEELGPLPVNARAAEYLPYDALFPKLAAFVTNGGYGGLHFALRHGVPIVAAGTSEDKIETNARVEWSGAGVRLKTNRPEPAAIRKAVRRVLSRPSYRDSAQRLGAEIAAAPGLAGIDAAIAELALLSRA